MLNRLIKLRDQKSQEKGFTIIEVMIVLAIAGLIIAIVLFAVPALQRQGRNTAIKSDANQFAGYVSNFASDNQGATASLACTTITAGAVSVQGGATGSCTGAASTGKIQAGTLLDKTTCTAGTACTPSTGTLYLEVGKCPDTASGATVTGVTSNRSFAIIYATETSGAANVAQCIST